MAKKITLYLDGKHDVQLEADRILANNVILPGEYNPHKVALWVIGNEYGPLGAVWAESMDDAFDELVDAGLGGGLLIDDDGDEDENDDDGITRLGNAGEAADLTYAWAQVVVFAPARDWQLLCAFAEARGAGDETLQ